MTVITFGLSVKLSLPTVRGLEISTGTFKDMNLHDLCVCKRFQTTEFQNQPVLTHGGTLLPTSPALAFLWVLLP